MRTALASGRPGHDPADRPVCARRYKGIALALTDLIGGHVQLVLTSLPSALGHVQSGRLKPLAVAGEQRSPFAPDIPTAREGGVDFVAELWWGLAAPAATAPAIIDELSDAMRRAMQSAELRKHYAAQGGEPVPMTPQEFTRFVLGEVERWRGVVNDTGLKLQ